jgi:hypothetical protein
MDLDTGLEADCWKGNMEIIFMKIISMEYVHKIRRKKTRKEHTE